MTMENRARLVDLMRAPDPDLAEAITDRVLERGRFFCFNR